MENVDWNTGLHVDILALVVASGANELKAMRQVSKDWKAGFDQSVGKLKLRSNSPLLPPNGLFAERFPSVRTLDLSCKRTQLLQRLAGSNLTCLVLRGWDTLTDDCLAKIADLPLTDLDLGDCDQLTDLKLVQLMGLPLTRLNLKGCRGLGGAGWDFLEGFAQLEDLDLGNCAPLSCAVLARLRGMPLRRLIAPNLRGLRDAPQALAPLAEMPLLTELSLASSNLTDPGLALFRGRPLTSLDISGHTGLTPAGLEAALKEMPSLRSLFLGSPGVRRGQRFPLGGALRRWLEGKPLTALSLRYSVMDADLAELMGLPLTDLDLGLGGVSDAGLAHLIGLPLSRLNLEGLNVGAGIGSLLGAPLSDLDLSHCYGVTVQGNCLGVLECAYTPDSSQTWRTRVK